MIDHISSIRFKTDPSYFCVGMAGDEACHDPYLLKAEYSTCRGLVELDILGLANWTKDNLYDF
jgi:hypothetical protein